MKKTFPKRGDIWIVNLDPTTGSEIAKTRPCLVLSENNANSIIDTVIVIPISSGEARFHQFEITLKPQDTGLKKISHLVIHQIKASSKLRFNKCIGSVSNENFFAEIKWRLDKYLGYL